MKYDHILNTIKAILAIAYILFLLKQFFVPVSPLTAASIHVYMATALVICFQPIQFKKPALLYLGRVIDLCCIGIALSVVYHYYVSIPRLETRLEMIDDILWSDKYAFIAGGLMLFEAVRRSVGFSLLSVVLIFVAYGFLGPYFPGWTAFEGFSLDTMTELISMQTDGLFGITASTAINFVFFFVMFGCVFTITGGGSVFIDLAMMATASLKGGAAKMSLLGSALFGMVSGSAVANTTSTGVLTIPIMKRSGYTKEQAAATEAIASTGGQLMPPIMGIAAFVMADMLGIPYTDIAAAGIIPAAAFYFALFVIIDLRARKSGVGNISKEDLNFEPLRPRMHLLISPLFLIIALVAGYSAPYAAFVGTVVALLAPLLRKSTRYSYKVLFPMLMDTARQMAWVSVPLASVGIIMVLATQSNLAFKFVEILSEIGSNNLYLSLIMVIIGCIIMGMGLPTVAAYIIGSIIFAPAIIDMGVDRLAANMFIMYYCVLSMVTPPVALCAYAASAIGKSDSSKTGFIAFSYALVIFLVPFSFISDPVVLWKGSWYLILIAFIGMLVATFCWAVFLQGWLKRDLNWLERLLFLIASIGLVLDTSASPLWLLFLTMSAALIVWCWKTSGRYVTRVKTA
ncbi:TRAP transporter permease [Vibrio mangrovi]|uniref:DctM-like transporters n=1 Tax=Vibrio mangrovi TaxID=474394 RepID=A0A1Y6ITV3_9VIBR|nr:TRAP transporter fused permease subunit [Vibrio mangrovi]MDW6004765.1 TRAP transporter fused permease subunit [Vibrio mangrovi]SMS01056.1 DctM-like transporters [Vibrio mangrovi]